jgi:hypothetical protein
VARLPPPNFETGDLYTPEGWVPHSYAERVSICLESGMTLREARRVASEDEARRAYDRMGHGGRL